MSKPRGTVFPDNIGVLAADLSHPGALTNTLFEVREAVVRSLAEYGAIELHRQAMPPAKPAAWDFWLTLTGQGASTLTPGELKVYDGVGWVEVTPLTFAAALLAKGLPAPSAGALTNDGAGRFSWVPWSYPSEPSRFGAVGDGVQDDTTALQKLAASGSQSMSLGAGKTYLIKDTIRFAPGCDLDFSSSKIIYAGPRNRPAVLHGTPGILNRATLARVHIVAQTIDWSHTEFVGLRVYNLSRGRITGDLIFGFTIGHEAYSLGQGYAHAYHQILAIQNCKYGTVLTCDGSLGLNYVNENIWDGGDWTNHSNTKQLGNCYGVWFRMVNGGYGHNMNRWFAPCFQVGDGQPGDERIPFLFDNCGNHCTVFDARFESGRGPFARLRGSNVFLNEFDIGCTSGKHIVRSIDETELARFNTIKFRSHVHETSGDSIVLDLFANVHAYTQSDVSVSGGLHVTDANGRPVANSPMSLGIKPRLSSIELTSSSLSIGFFVRTLGGEAFTLRVDSEPDHPGRLMVALFDENFVQLTDKSSTFPDFAYAVFGSNHFYAYARRFGGSYSGNAGMPSDTLSFRVGSAVRYIRAFVTGGSARIRSLGLDRLSPSGKLLTLFNPLPGRTETRYVGGDPSEGSIGVYAAGDILPNAQTSKTAPAYYQCIRSGRLAPPWSVLTGYDTEDLVERDGSIYVCTRSGWSGVSGGPSGTAAGISDGTAEWRYLTTKALFHAR